MERGVFEIKGFTKDYYVNNKLIGSIRLEQPDRDNHGYSGRIKEILVEEVYLTNKKTIRKGTEVFTELMPICGRSSTKFFGAKERLEQARKESEI